MSATRITMRLDDAVIAHFKSKGNGRRGYQTLINAALLTHVNEETQTVKEQVKEAISEVLQEFSVLIRAPTKEDPDAQLKISLQEKQV